MLYESQLEQKTVNSTNAINPLDSKDVDTNAGVMFDNIVALSNRLGITPNALPMTTAGSLANLLTPHMIWALKNQQFNFDKSNTNRINFQIPCPLFYVDELLHFGSDGKCDIVLNCDPMWASNLIQIAGSEQVNLTAVAYN